ncbi:NAD(P)/FAD-dependent oxidoreductase [Luteipulveratus sp. YIM 133132]|uniref:flavin-containing monooxygenase n=1 Tax=Luteipulveratus flavus TaxID=3031728 RepID=UPI0023AF0D3F|nr:NAD(P)/FAD-dependent oxidoreductase [Luteipulveratus sp. YIM 133132]MDE9365574.1 NAD(P)/FAD-dependent oxidoreductase [Luteipulveratus sp. YIM 133132]
MSLPVDHDTVIVGGGFSGIAMAIALKAAGRDDLVVLEKAEEVGGTWRENRYPGCECDVPAHLYSYSFELNPYWSQTYAPSDEIQDYLLYCVEKYDVRRHIEFDATVQDAAYDEESSTWTVTMTSSWGTLRTLRARSLVLAVGALHEPSIPDIPGMESFAGEMMHTATWDPGTTVERKHVSVIGTGSSGVQIIPSLAEDAVHLTVFQRTPAWVMPRTNRQYADRLIDTFEQHPTALAAHRARLKATSDLRERGLTSAPRLLKAASRLALENLHSAVKSPQLRAVLTPDYPMGCKRILLSSDYYPALARPDVTVETDPIERIERDAVVTKSGRRHHTTVLVLATGFDPVGSYRYLGIKGADGHLLSADWDDGATTYLGVTVPHFPNLFLLLGPNSLLGHTSDLQIMEAQVGLVVRLLAERDRRHARSVAVRPQVVPGFVAELDRRSERTVYLSGCSSWYLDRGGRNRTLWPGSVGEYERRTTRPEMVDYLFT